MVAVTTPVDLRRSAWFLLLLSLSHAVIDINAGAVIALLPALRERFDLTYTLVGAVPLVWNLAGSLTQPIFGYLSDRSAERWIVPASLAAMGLSMTLIAFMPTFPLVLAAIVVGALGSAAFHPEGAHAAHNLAGKRRAWAMGLYSVGGNLGFGLGPVYAALLLMLGGGLTGVAWAILLPAGLAYYIYRQLPAWQAVELAQAQSGHQGRAREGATNWRGMVLVTILVIIRSIIHNGLASFLPFYWIDVLGNPAQTAPYVQVTYLLAGVAGTLAGARFADRIGVRRALILAWLALVPLQAAVPMLGGWMLLVMLFCSGFVIVSTFTTTLVMTQDYMPRSLGLASGINLGLAWGLGGVGTLGIGAIADRYGVVSSLWILAALVPLALIISLLLPATGAEVAQRRRD